METKWGLTPLGVSPKPTAPLHLSTNPNDGRLIDQQLEHAILKVGALVAFLLHENYMVVCKPTKNIR